MTLDVDDESGRSIKRRRISDSRPNFVTAHQVSETTWQTEQHHFRARDSDYPSLAPPNLQAYEAVYVTEPEQFGTGPTQHSGYGGGTHTSIGYQQADYVETRDALLTGLLEQETTPVYPRSSDFLSNASWHETSTFSRTHDGYQCLESPYEQDVKNCLRETENVICYGMLDDMKFEYLNQIRGDILDCSVTWDDEVLLKHPEYDQPVAKLSQNTSKILKTMQEHAKVIYEFYIRSSITENRSMITQTKRIKKVPGPQKSQKLLVIIYGPFDLAERVGEWLSSLHMFLQEPELCEKDVPYKNPHSLTFDDDERITTFHLAQNKSAARTMEVQKNVDLFADLYNDYPFEEAQQPPAISTSLHKHQKQALRFMTLREQGWDVESARPDVWKSYLSTFGMIRYRNTLSGTTQSYPPSGFRGGILADEMGLGKTCSLLSLIAMNGVQGVSAATDCTSRLIKPTIKASLIIVPFSLLHVWERQIAQHFHPHAIRPFIYYGPTCQLPSTLIVELDVVVTTYNTVASQWKKLNGLNGTRQTSPLFDNHWHRIVLDEAHVIRNSKTMNAKAVYALEGDNRWCITGTPIQNRLVDMYSLLRFLRVYPYDDYKAFDSDILRPWKTTGDEDALKRLQSLVKMISLRRPRAVIDLPERLDLQETVSLTCDERCAYERARAGAIDVIDSAMNAESSKGSAYLNAFQKINILRFICNHGVSPNEHKMRINGLTQNAVAPTPDLLQNQLDQLFACNELTCVNCGTDLQDECEDRAVSPANLRPQHSSLCVSCMQDTRPDTGALFRSSPLLDITETWSPCSSSNNSVATPTPGYITTSTSTSSAPCFHPSSKIHALVTALHGIPNGEKCAIFSYWTTTLDDISHALRESGIPYVRYDGRMSRSKRTTVLESFANDSALRVILVSISCGGQGLDLTAANHAYLMEPQWNPMMEEQALARVHRLGQTKPVRMVRFVVKDTWEEKVIMSQKQKKMLADLVVDRKSIRAGEEARKQLFYLKELLV